jgi:hypothetical protein
VQAVNAEIRQALEGLDAGNQIALSTATRPASGPKVGVSLATANQVAPLRSDDREST